MGSMVTLAPGTGSIRIRSTVGQWAWLVGALSVLLLLTQGGLTLLFSDPSGPTARATVSSAATFCVVWGVSAALVYRWQGVTLTPQALRVHSLSPRTIPWPDIDSVTADRVLGTTYVIVTETSGRRTRLRAPCTGLLAWDGAFDRKHQTLVDWHQALRG